MFVCLGSMLGVHLLLHVLKISSIISFPLKCGCSFAAADDIVESC